MKFEMSSPDKSINDLASEIYEDADLSVIAKFEGTIDELNEQYKIECIRKENNSYRVSYPGNDSVAILLFDENGDILWGRICRTRFYKTDFEKLTTDQTLNDVKAFDSDGDYTFLYAGRNDTPRKSSHYTKDGYMIIIEYDVLNKIICIDAELI